MEIPKKLKSDVTKDFILKTALDIFSREDFENVSMRTLAKEAGLSLGAFYYHFQNKEELVLYYYNKTCKEAELENQTIVDNTKDFNLRFKEIINYKFKQLSENRHLVKILARNGANFQHPLSPFSKHTKEMRDNSINLISKAISGSNLKSHKTINKHLPSLLWLYQMLITLYWANDQSSNQSNTQLILDKSLKIIIKLLSLSNSTFMSPINKAIIVIIEITVSGLEVNEKRNVLN